MRDYRPADLDACRALFEQLLQTHRDYYPDAEIAGEFTPEGSIYVVEDDGRIVGYAGLLWHGKRAELEPIVVAREARGQGAGRALAEHVIEQARADGAIRVFVGPVGRNQDAMRFFHQLGFDVLGYVQLQIDLEPRDRRPGEQIAGRQFKV